MRLSSGIRTLTGLTLSYWLSIFAASEIACRFLHQEIVEVVFSQMPQTFSTQTDTSCCLGLATCTDVRLPTLK